VSVTIFYASDLHGAEVLWRKFVNAGKFYGVDMLVMGGDIAGKAVVPIEKKNGGYLAPQVTGDRLIGGDEVPGVEQRIRDMGYYPYVVDTDELDRLLSEPAGIQGVFRRLIVESFENWVALAEERLANSGIRLSVMLGNDDEPALREVLEASALIEDAESHVVDVGEGFQMVSSGWSNPTPWNSPREMLEEELEKHLSELMQRLDDPARGILSSHVPPYQTQLDQAPVLDENLRPMMKGGTMLMDAVGSKAVRNVIERFHPALSLHGHVHESRGIVRIGKTLCINPGSVYSDGILRGVLVEFGPKGKLHYQLTSG
jgi:Icc-related predicted phosphoesterase